MNSAFTTVTPRGGNNNAISHNISVISCCQFVVMDTDCIDICISNYYHDYDTLCL
jgi:hypothetical protein